MSLLILAFQPGQEVKYKQGDFRVVINKVIIEREAVLYEIEWMIDKEFRSCILYGSEIEAVDDTEKLQIETIDVKVNNDPSST